MTTLSASSALAVPWTTKYRPTKFSQMLCQTTAVETLKESLNRGNIPHLLLHGPPGTGKTSLCKTLICHMYPQQQGEGSNAWQERLKDSVLDLNASDERGIDMVRSKIKEFAKQAPVFWNASGASALKLVVLDEADQMTLVAQSALRRIMEEYSATTRFCIICNVVTRILPAIASRCLKFRFRAIPDDAMLERLVSICRRENLISLLPATTNDAATTDATSVANTLLLSSRALDAVVRIAAGDMRKAITCLQSVALLVDARSGEEVSDSDIYDTVGDVPPFVADDLLQACVDGPFDRVRKQVESVIYSAYNVNLVLERLAASIAKSTALDDLAKADALCKVAAVDDTLRRDGADGYMQLMDIATFIWDLLLPGAEAV